MWGLRFIFLLFFGRVNLNSLTMHFNSSFLGAIDVDWETVFVSSAGLLKPLVIDILATETSDSHVSWLVGQVLVTQLSWTLLNNSIVERFGLVELFSILSSVLISVSVSLGGPASAIPEGWVHHVARAVVKERLSRSIKTSLILDVFMDLQGSLFRKFPWRITVPEHRRRLLLWINEARSESRFIWSIFWMIVRVSLWHGLSSVSPGRGIESVVSVWDPLCIESVTSNWILVLKFLLRKH